MRTTLIALVLLSGCAQTGPLAGKLDAMIGGNRHPKGPSVIEVTPSALPHAGERLHATIAARNATATLAIEAVNGTVTTWHTADNVTLSFDRGVLVGTRGLGDDLMGAGAEKTLTALAGGNPGPYRRQLRYLDGENHSVYVSAGCTMTAGSTELFNGQRLRRHDELCKTFHQSFTNTFWTDAHGTVRRARQWVGPEVGYLETWR
ncbi:YjbF family lipoprotein [Acidimangrovimonas pyrenivorans]|uniref:YjbF family lipoprotein n=1 Tax=Acidimangrovimonas pyrenivorans TaxID=2030798 RepID=A0ABV7ANT5_9RHOB